MRYAWMCVVLAALMAAPLAEAAEKSEERPRIEVVFVLDTTGSMSGLIKAAKEKIWAIANTLATTKPAPEIRMGLVGYRDRGDAYVTQVTSLTDDLDAVYSKLMAFSAKGGGDTPESVNQALNEAVTKIQWSAGDKVYRVIFLVGDCPPHMDYKDDVKYQQTCEIAAKNGIIINTVQCGSHAATTPIWMDIAKRSEGNYFQVGQSGSAILANTPFDAELAKLAGELDETRIYYGTAKERAAQEARVDVAREISGKASVSASARRASFNAGKAGERNFAGKQELIQAVENGTVKIGDLKDKDLPENMQKMDAKERTTFVEKNIARRKELRTKIKELAKKRQDHIKAQIEKNKLNAKGSLDHGVYDAIKAQGAKKDIKLEGGPKY